jgi:hypothetical protein
MSDETLTGELASRVLGWVAAPDRFLMGGRRWLPRWRFRPAENLADAFQLLEAASPEQWTMGGDKAGDFSVRVQLRGVIGEARNGSKPRAITLALARALGLEPPEGMLAPSPGPQSLSKINAT